MDGRELDGQALQLAKGQHGVFAYSQMAKLGATRSQLRHRLTRGAWSMWLPGVARMAWCTDELRSRAMATTLWAGTGSVASHETAGALWGMISEHSRHTQVSAPHRLCAFHPWIRTHSFPMPPRNVTRFIERIPVTSPALTLIQLAARPRLDLDAMVEAAIRERLLTIDELTRAFNTIAVCGRPGVRRMRRLLKTRLPENDRLESELERRALDLFRTAGLPTPRCQHTVVHRGTWIGKVDFAWPDSKVLVETDGYAFHSARRVWNNDLRRHNRLLLAGWTPLRLSWDDVCEGAAEVIAQLLALCKPLVAPGAQFMKSA